MSACMRTGCGGQIASDGYCDTCGYAGTTTPSSAPAVPSTPPPPPPPVAAAQPLPSSAPPRSSLNAGLACNEFGCNGSIAADGYCDTCGMQYSDAPPAGASPVGAHGDDSTTATATIAVPQAPSTSTRVGAGKGEASRRTRTTRSTSRRNELGAGLVSIAPTTAGDPSRAVMSEARIAQVLGEKPEDERFCSACGEPVGRGHGGEPGRVKGFCGNCRTPFDFITNAPKLAAGELVGNQYRILGPIAHGGMGWIYLGQDTMVSDRWVVLKGLLNKDDPDAVASAVAEREFLARIDHGSIVGIYNFVTWKGAGYIVMEYVGGQSLNSKLKKRRQANGGTPDPLPVPDAIAYILGILPALGYLHNADPPLIYNDLKPANMMAVADTVKLIDVGGVMQVNDTSAAIFGTQGFQAPEVAEMGPSVASDLYTVGRTLAVLCLNFVFHQGKYQYALPTPADEPLFDRWESLYRFLLKATAPHPDDRFQTADEMGEQLMGVLREIVAISSGAAQPAASALFGGDRLAGIMLEDDTIHDADWRALPTPKVDPDDNGAPFLYDLPELDPEATIRLIDEGLSSGSAPDSVEVRLRRAREMIELGQSPPNILRSVEHFNPWDWRVTRYRSVVMLATASAAGADLGAAAQAATQAAEGFSQVWTELPGELAPKLAVALSAEMAGEHGRASELYAEVISVDSSYVSAAFGLARCRAAIGDRSGAVSAYRSVPASSATYTEAQVASARVLVGDDSSDAPPSHADLAEASRTINAARLDATAKSKLAAEVLERALAGVRSGDIPEDPAASVFGHPLTETGLRHSLEAAYRDLARVAETAPERFALVDKANAVRVRTLI